MAVLVALATGCSEAVVARPPDRVVVEPEWVEMELGETARLTATAIWLDGMRRDVSDRAAWRGGNADMVAVEGGVVTGVGRGSTVVEATFDGITGRAAVIVSAALESCVVLPRELTLEPGEIRELGVEGTFGDGSTESLTSEAEWSSDDESIVAMTTRAAHIACPGTTFVRASIGDLPCSPATVTVPEDPLCVTLSVEGREPELDLGELDSLWAVCTGPDGEESNVTGDATWSSSDPSVADFFGFSPARVHIESRGTGTTEIVATLFPECPSDPRASEPWVVRVWPRFDSAVVRPEEAELHGLGETLQYEVLCEYEDGTTEDCLADTTWYSEHPEVATVSESPGSEGLATAHGVGTTRLRPTVRSHLGPVVTLHVLAD